MNHQQQNQQTQQALAAIDAMNLPLQQKNFIKNGLSQAHIATSVAFHFAEYNNHQFLSPLSQVGTTVSLNFSNMNQMVNLGAPQASNLGDIYALPIAPFALLLILNQPIAMQRIPGASLPQLIQARGITNAVSKISERRGLLTCFTGECGGSSNQCIWLEVPLNGAIAHGAVVACKVHSPSYKGNELLDLPAGAEIYLC